MSATVNLVEPIRSSLNAKLQRLLERPLIAKVVNSTAEADEENEDAFWNALRGERKANPWVENPDDGSVRVEVEIDYRGRWDGCEKEVRQLLTSVIEEPVYFLTEEEKWLLDNDPRAFLKLETKPGATELLRFEPEGSSGGGHGDQVVALVLNGRPDRPEKIGYIAVIPNLVQIERQLDALKLIEDAGEDDPVAPLRSLVGLNDGSRVANAGTVAITDIAAADGEELDEFQRRCVAQAVQTPHFAVIQGPPGSGKTTVIASIVRRSIETGKRVLIVSPTHVAVDNVVEKLAPKSKVDSGSRRAKAIVDDLTPHTVPLRYATRPSKLSDHAKPYWVGKHKQLRGATIAKRVEQRLRASVPFAEELFNMVDQNAPGRAPLSSAIAATEDVICGTPIGILSHATVKDAGPGAFDLLIVDEVSKMTLPEFLAIAVKARRWVLVGDPEQLPPYNNVPENATTLNEMLDPQLELVCSVGAVLQIHWGDMRPDVCLIVVAEDPESTAIAIRAHIDESDISGAPCVATLGEDSYAGILVCSLDELEQARTAMKRRASRPGRRTLKAFGAGVVLVERGIEVDDPIPDGEFVADRWRMANMTFDVCYNTYHSLSWSRKANVKLRHSKHRNGLRQYLPSEAALVSLDLGKSREELVRSIAVRFAVNTISVYDWLTGMNASEFDVSPLKELHGLCPRRLCDAVRPYVGVLELQYRMEHQSLSRIPREVFYFEKALHDCEKVKRAGGPKVMLVHVEQAPGTEGAETNEPEASEVEDALRKIAAMPAEDRKEPRSIMIITPYSAQEAFLLERVDQLKLDPSLSDLRIDVCTLDRCQGKEADFVLISLVKGRASPFMDIPKRWNVAVTRARMGLVFIGNIDAFLTEAEKAIQQANRQPAYAGRGVSPSRKTERPEMSILAYLLSQYRATYRLVVNRSHSL